MRGGFRGRVSFARGNTAWSRNFNINLENARRGFVTVSGCPTHWRISSIMVEAACEVPRLCGFAEQFRDMASNSLILSNLTDAEGELDTDEQVTISTDPAVETFITTLMSCCGSMTPKTWSICCGFSSDKNHENSF